MNVPSWAPEGTDLSRPSAARVYDFYLGGHHNLPVDRELAERAMTLWPGLPDVMRANRAFLRRAVTEMVRLGVRQFLDLGAGIPTVGSAHEVARALAPDCRVVHVDIDPVAVAQSRVLIEGDPSCAVLQADLRDPDAVLGSPEVARVLDLDRPLGVLMVSVLHFVEDDDQARGAVARLHAAVADGSHLALSQAASDLQDPARSASHQELYRRSGSPMTMRDRARVAALFDGFTLVGPGLVEVDRWHGGDAAAAGVPTTTGAPTSTEGPTEGGTPAWAGLARKG